MSFAGRQIFARLPQLSLPCSGGHGSKLSSKVQRVTAFHNVQQSHVQRDGYFRNALISAISRRTYADRPVGRPKSHTGRTTSARKAPTTSKTKAAKKPAAKKTTPKARPKATQKAKPKPRSKAKSKAKPKPTAKPRKRRTLTEAQKKAVTIRTLKDQALKPPHGVPSNAWAVFLAEHVKANSGGGGRTLGASSKEASGLFKNLEPERLEHYNHIAVQGKKANEKAYRAFIESHTPAVIRAANKARLNLRHRKIVKGQYYSLQDERQVKGQRSSYTSFCKDRFASGDLKGLKVTEAARLMAREWKALSVEEKKPYQDAAAQDHARYAQEMKTVYNRDIKSSARAAAAA